MRFAADSRVKSDTVFSCQINCRIAEEYGTISQRTENFLPGCLRNGDSPNSDGCHDQNHVTRCGILDTAVAQLQYAPAYCQQNSKACSDYFFTVHYQPCLPATPRMLPPASTVETPDAPSALRFRLQLLLRQHKWQACRRKFIAADLLFD
ncbi:hypothetical protein ACFPVS_07525 [Neisseria weixii]|uniref:hypothetical protein n=1 Tax=Neisseria weixii TaxID=1853276 RepID=UPI00360D1AF0